MNFQNRLSLYIDKLIILCGFGLIALGPLVALSHLGELTTFQKSILIVGTTLLGLLSFLSVRLPPKLKVDSFFIIVFGFLGLYVLEGVLLASDSVRLLVFQIVRNEDARSGPRVALDLRDNGIVAYRAKFDDVPTIKTNGGEQSIFPHGLISNTKIVLCKEGSGWIVIDTDRFGFRNPDNLWDIKDVDAIAIGDSYIHGHCLEKGIVERMRSKLPSIVNLGRSGSGPLDYLARLVEYSTELKPKYVFWFHLETNDIPTGGSDPANRINYLDPNFTLSFPEIQPQIDRELIKKHEERLKNWIDNNDAIVDKTDAVVASRFVDFLLLRNFRKSFNLSVFEKEKFILDSLPPDPTENDIQNYKKILIRAKGLVKSIDSQLVIVYLPHEGTLRHGMGRPNPAQVKIQNLVNSLNIKFVDTTAAMAALDVDEIYDRSGWHPNELGAQTIVDVVLKEIFR